MKLPILAWVYDRRKVGSPKKEATVELRITYLGRQKFVSTGVRVLPKQWRHDMVVNRLDAQELNKSLEIILTSARRVVNDMLEEGSFTLDELPGRLKRAMGGEKSFIEFARERSEVRCYGRSKDSRERYARFMRFFEAWGVIKYFGDVTDQNIITCDSELRKRGMRAYSAWNNYHRFLNSFILDAIQEGYMRRNPYKWLHIDKDKRSHALEKHLTKEVCADSGYGSEQNYEFMENNGIEAYVKYNWFHKEQHHPFRNDPFRMENMYYNWKDDYYVCPMGQHMEHVGHKKSVSDNGYVSLIDTYRAQRCEGCPLRGQCFKGKGNRTINANHMAFNLQKLIKNVGKDQIKAVMEAFSALFDLLLASLWTLWGKFHKEETSVNKNRQLSNRNLMAA